MIGIYMYENKLNGKKYIGQSTNISRRKEEHWSWPSKYSRFDNELRAIGKDGFNFVILEECPPEMLDERETYWIKFYNTVEDGYNLTYGGQSYRGEANPGAKLMDEDIYQIIILLEECKLNNKQIAELYKVHYNTIDFINRCKTWTHLHNYTTNIRNENLKKLEKPRTATAGESNGVTKITQAKAEKIIELLKTSKNSLAQIARDENVSEYIVYDINRCRTWRFLHNYKKNIRNEFRKDGDANDNY